MNSSCIDEHVAQFVLFCQQRIAEEKESKKDGGLIFDEVKVISRLMWNSRSQTLIHVEMSSLADIYQTLDQESATQTSYILWRDLTSDFDIIGPYFTNSKTMDSKFIISCILETIRLFHDYRHRYWCVMEPHQMLLHLRQHMVIMVYIPF